MGAVNYKEIWVWITKHIQDDKIKKLLGVEFIKTPAWSAIAEILAEVNYLELEKVFRIWINELVDTSMMDRLIHTAHKLDLKGPSMREYLAKL